jgi:hypothetical protein
MFTTIDEISLKYLPKVGSITADNAANNNTMMRHLETRFRKVGVPFDRNGNRVRYHAFSHLITTYLIM